MEYGDKTYFIEHFSEAVEKGYIQAYYQPIYRSITGKLMCAESLARWIDPEKGMFSPALFIPALEDSDLIFELDMEILRQTCDFYKEMTLRGTPIPSFSVNLSRRDFRHDVLYERVANTLDSYGVPHDAINLEVTESLMIEENERFNCVLQRFNDSGFSMWIDDFGSGYSSLNVLKNFNFDLMKFDMVFLRDFSVKGKKVLASLVYMAKSLGIHTLMEGIETKEQQQFMLDAGCEALQGFLFSKPCSKSELTAMIDEKKCFLESVEDKEYWDQIGRLNFLSTHPLEEFSDLDISEDMNGSGLSDMGIPLALLECTRDTVKYVYASETYLSRTKNMGFDSTDEIEKDFNSHKSEQSFLMKKFVDDAISLGTIQKVEYTAKDVYYRLSGKCLARKKDSAMIAFYLNTFDSEKEVETANELIYQCNSLFSTYEVVALMYPDKGIVNRIYTSNVLPEYDKESSLQLSIRKFCEKEVDPSDQERYLDFLDFDKAIKRIEENPQKFVQGYFRMRWNDSHNNWHSVRLSKVSSSADKAYLLTIQKLHRKGIECLDILNREHPELFSGD